MAGAETVADDGRPRLAAFAARVMDDAIPTLRMLPGADAAGYKRSLLECFRNPALRQLTWQIAMDGSQKLPQRILSAMRDRLSAGLPIKAHALVVAGWMRFAAGVGREGPG